MKKYNYYIFDWDGTLANTLEVWFQAYLRLFDQYGIHATYKEIATKAYGDPYGSVKFGIKDYEEFNKELFALVEKQYTQAALYPWVKKVLNNIHNEKQSRICIFSSTQREMLIEALKYQQLLEYTDLIIGREDVTKLKPDPEGIAIALNKYNYSKKKTVIIGDSDKDIKAGNVFGIDTILFLPKKNYQYISEGLYEGLNPTFKISSLAKLF